ncbi:ribonuclease domain-containing protein [Butyrivibrio sp. XPD2006]|uniref:ribonuclease domain-containing protein n=1 Tax=Butyrivibrio sp. XPD2006 TaxID=1280668 RepID=UPI0003B55559|nr:ribonuclease domain-containing protein [Butyrivibrio sp. XPD2006]
MNLTRKKISRRGILPLILVMTLLMLFTGCQKKPAASQQPEQTATEQATTAQVTTAQTTEQGTTDQPTTVTEQTPAASEENTNLDAVATQAAAGAITETTAATESAAGAITEATAAAEATTEITTAAGSTTKATTEPASVAENRVTASATEATTEPASVTETQAIAEDGTYTTKDDVALYIHTYGKLPENFITKKAAKKLGWQGGSLEDYAPGKCIGGDYFGNYEGLLPEDKEYHECDIDTLGKSKRGAKRIIYSDDGYIYYTGDHYESFELLYEP